MKKYSSKKVFDTKGLLRHSSSDSIQEIYKSGVSK